MKKELTMKIYPIIYVVWVGMLCFSCQSFVKQTDSEEIYDLLKQADSCSLHRKEEQAIQKYFEILKYAEDAETPLFLGDIYNKLGAMFLYRNLYVDAIDMFRKGAKLYHKGGAWREEALAWRNIGRANLMRQRSDSIIFYYQRAIGLAEETGEQEVLKDLQREFQFVCSKHALLQGDTRLWLHYLDMLDTSDASYLLVGTLLARQSVNNEEAEARLLKAADSKDLYIKANAYRALYDYSKKIGDGEKTALYSDLYIQYADSLEKKYSLSLSLHELGENYEKQRMEAENERLKNRQLKRTMYWSSVVVFLCMILLFGIQYYHKEKRKRKREMARLMKQIREKEHVIEDLRKHQYEKEKREGVFIKCEDVLPKRYTAFDSLYKLKVQPYYNMIEAEDEWLEVYAIINLLYGDIVGKLERYPQLSMLDVRTCYLVHARLSNTDIAALFNIDSRSVSKAKQRIKKKMEIDSELSLEDYLMK